MAGSCVAVYMRLLLLLSLIHLASPAMHQKGGTDSGGLPNQEDSTSIGNGDDVDVTGSLNPPDSFRRLAAVLSSRGDKVENRLTRKFLYNRNITCNDGSPAGYYIRRSPASSRWIIFLEGGSYCFDEVSCGDRWHWLRTLMSSERWPAVKAVGGILSSDRMENPHFADANHVLVPYCSSDTWSGSARRRPGDRFSFLGAEIVQEVVRELFSWEHLAAASQLYMAGSSAGGTGVLVNLDPVADLVRAMGAHRMRVRGIVDSGWFLDNVPFSGKGSSGDNMEFSSQRARPAATAASHTIRTGIKTWSARVPKSCSQEFPGEEWKCFFGYRIYPTMKTPVFVFQWQFDQAQMTVDNVGAPVTPAQWDYIHIQGRNIRHTFERVEAVFAPSCIAHTVITKPTWTQVKVDGTSLPDALQCWVSKTLRGEIEEEETAVLLVGEKKENVVDDELLLGSAYLGGRSREKAVKSDSNNHEPLTSSLFGSSLLKSQIETGAANFDSSSKIRSYSAPDTTSSIPTSVNLGLLTDHQLIAEKYNQVSLGSSVLRYSANPPYPPPLSPPQQQRESSSRYRLNSNLVRSLDSTFSSVSSIPPGPLTNSINNQIKKVRHQHNFIDNRTSKTKKMSMPSKYNCKYGNTLENRIKCAKEENRLLQETNNKDLLRSLDSHWRHGTVVSPPTTKKRRKRRRRKRGRKTPRIRVEGEENMTKEERKLRRREERKRLKRQERRRRLERQRSQRESVGGRKHQQERKKDSGRRDRREVEREGSVCETKYIDTCNWPQCNRSCPKLHNPVTGEEMDFRELLESFGLELPKVAAALGIDIIALNNMDEGVLLHLLTSQQTQH